MQWNWHVETMGIGSQVYVMVTSLALAELVRLGAGAVELVCVGRLSRMGGESLLLPVWRSAGGAFTGKGE